MLSFLTSFCNMFQCFVCLSFAFFLLFCPGRWIFVSDSLSFLCFECWVMEGLRFLFFKLLTFKNPDLVFLLRCSLHCVLAFHILICIFLALSWHLHLYSFFFQFLENWMISAFFLDFCHFFDLQLVSFNIDQYWEFARKSFPKLPLISIFCNFLAALVLFLNDFFPLIFFLLFCLFYDFSFGINMKSCSRTYIQQRRSIFLFLSQSQCFEIFL